MATIREAVGRRPPPAGRRWSLEVDGAAAARRPFPLGYGRRVARARPSPARCGRPPRSSARAPPPPPPPETSPPHARPQRSRPLTRCRERSRPAAYCGSGRQGHWWQAPPPHPPPGRAVPRGTVPPGRCRQPFRGTVSPAECGDAARPPSRRPPPPPRRACGPAGRAARPTLKYPRRFHRPPRRGWLRRGQPRPRPRPPRHTVPTPGAALPSHPRPPLSLATAPPRRHPLSRRHRCFFPPLGSRGEGAPADRGGFRPRRVDGRVGCAPS